MKPITENIIAVRGGGDLATGVIQKLWRAGFKIVILEVPQPTAIRRSVSLCEAVYDGVMRVEDMTARLADSPSGCDEIWACGEIPMLVDPAADSLNVIRPDGVVDAILAKRSLGTNSRMAEIVIALGPGFTAPEDAHAVIETMRGHGLGKVIFAGAALPNTGVPGLICGKGEQRVLHSPCSAVVRHHRKIGDFVKRGEAVFTVGSVTVTAPFSGVLRGLIREGLRVPKGMKTADIDPRADSEYNLISDKARCIGGGVLEAYLYLQRRRGQ